MNILNLRKKNCIPNLIGKNFRKVVESLYIFLTIPDEVEKYVQMMKSSSSDNCLRHFNIKILNLFYLELH